MKATAEDRRKTEGTLHPGDLLDGKYRVDYLLGQGGMAFVWAATNERTGKRVAIKVLLPSLTATPGVDSLFQREGFAASRVDHPNVVTVFDLIEHQGMACIVMELLTGEPLDKLLERHGALDVNDACALLLPAMRGVSAAHAQGVIHRDLKPHNIFVCMGSDGRALTTKVLDFGISLMLGRAREPTVGQGPSVLMGTPAYMAPEQIWDGAPIDERADVYGLGVLFYETLTGEVPFPGEPGPALFLRILDNAPPPLARQRPDLSPNFAQIIETALAKSPGDRHPTVDAMILALEQEVLGAAPLRRASTPSSGLALGLPFEVASGSRTTPVDALLHRGLAGEHQATKFLVGFPLEAEGAQRPTGSLASEGSRGSDIAGHDRAAVTTARASALLPVRRWLHPHRWPSRAKVGTVALLAATTLGVWGLAGQRVHQPPDLPPLVLQAGPPADGKVTPPPGAPVVVVTPLAPSAPPARGEAVASATPAPNPERSPVARLPRSPAKPALAERTRKAPERRLVRAGAPIRNPASAPRSGKTGASSATQFRAGKLSEADL
jgi:hypothetical protein